MITKSKRHDIPARSYSSRDMGYALNDAIREAWETFRLNGSRYEDDRRALKTLLRIRFIARMGYAWESRQAYVCESGHTFDDPRGCPVCDAPFRMRSLNEV